MSRRKFTALYVMILFMTIMFFAVEMVQNIETVQCWAIVGIVFFIVEVMIWYYLSGELFSPYLVVFYVATIFCLGQIFGWGLNLDMGEYDLTTYVPRIADYDLLNALKYSIFGMAAFHVGAILNYHEISVRANTSPTLENDKDLSALVLVARIVFWIALPSTIYQLYMSVVTSLLGGYGDVYVLTASLSKIQRLILYPAEWFPIATLILYAAYHEEKTKRFLLNCIIFIYIAAILITGGRSGAVMFILAYLIERHYLIKPYSYKNIISMGCLGYLGIVLLNTIQITRTVGSRTFASIMDVFISAFPNAIGKIVGELGWSMSSLAWTMQLIPSTGAFRKGTSYIFAITAIIPNLGFWKVHPATLYSNLGEWMQGLLGRSSGLGYTFIAESYANFSWGGLIVLVVLGYIIEGVFNKVNKTNARFNYLRSFLIISLIACILKAFVRSSFSAIMRDLFFTIGLFFFMVYLVRKKMNTNT